MKTRILGITGAATLGALFTLMPTEAKAAGTALDVQGARGTGMASATTAWIDDASSIYYNPAGIAQGEKVMVEAGINAVIPSFKYTQPGTNTKYTTQGIVTPFQVYAAAGLTEHVSIGVGVFTPFGLDVKWPSDWPGRSLITESSLRTYYIDPTMAVSFGPLKFGAGMQIVRGTLELQKDINFGGGDYGHADLGGGAWATAANMGLQLELIKKYLQFGAAYRGRVKLDFNNAQAHFSGIPAGFQSTLHDQPVMGSITQPDSAAFGLSSRVLDGLNVAVDAVWFHHSVFDAVTLHYPQDTTGTLDSSQPKNWHDTVNVHIGAEGTLSKNLQIRGGVLIDPTPARDNTLTPDVPDSTRVNLAAGATYKFDFGMHVDLGYQFIILTGKTSTVPQLPGDYGGFVNIVGFTIGYTSGDYSDKHPAPEPAGEGARIAPPSAEPEPPPQGGARPAPAGPETKMHHGGAEEAPPGSDDGRPPPPPPGGSDGAPPPPPPPPAPGF